MAAVGYESWRRVWALTLVDLAREDEEPGGSGHEAWLRAKVRGELNRGAGDGDGSSSTLPADAEALLRSTSARFSARRADRRPAPAV
jgi:hypothetical protein